MKDEDIIPSNSISASHSKEIEATPQSPSCDEKDKCAPSTVRKRPLSFNWKGFKSGFITGNATSQTDREPTETPPQCAAAKSDGELQDQMDGPDPPRSSTSEPTLFSAQQVHFPPRSTGLRPFSCGPTLSGYFSEGGTRKLFGTGSYHLSNYSKSSEVNSLKSRCDSECVPSSNFSRTAPAGCLQLERLAYRKASYKGGSSEIIYATDIDMAQRDGMPQTAATDIVVQRHRRRVRVKGKETSKQHKQKRHRRRTTIARRVRLGKPLDPQDDEAEYILTMGMMLGLRVAVGRQGNPLEGKELMIKDFYQVDKYVFPPSGSMGILSTPSHKLGTTFKFKDYSPRVFRHIREHFGVDRVDYILSVAGNYTFLEFISNAKSGEFFFFSHDEKFMIKTIKSSEVKFFRRILPHYYKHVKTNPQSLLVRFFGMYRVKMYHLRRRVVHFMVMNSVLDTPKVIHETFDIKGSTLGRYAKPGEKVKKDMDLVNRKTKIAIGPNREPFLKIIEADVKFLASMNIMDYSLLLGIHDRTLPREDDEDCTGRRLSPRRVSRFFNFVDEREGEDATKWQGEGDIDEQQTYHLADSQNVNCEMWDPSTGEDITIDDDDEDVESNALHSATMGSADSLNDHKDWTEEEPPASDYNYEPETQHPSEYNSTFPGTGVDSDEAVKVAAEVMKSKSAEGRKPEGSGGQAASPQKLSSVNGSQVYLPRRNDLGIQSVVR